MPFINSYLCTQLAELAGGVQETLYGKVNIPLLMSRGSSHSDALLFSSNSPHYVYSLLPILLAYTYTYISSEVSLGTSPLIPPERSGNETIQKLALYLGYGCPLINLSLA